MRKFRSGKEWQMLFAEQKRSGKSATEFCRERNIHPNVFYKKRREIDSGSFVKLPAIHSNSSGIKIKIKNITIEPGAGFSRSELLLVINTVLEAVDAIIQ